IDGSRQLDRRFAFQREDGRLARCPSRFWQIIRSRVAGKLSATSFDFASLSTMLLPTLIFSGQHWFWPAAAVLGVALVFLVWNYRAAPRGVVSWVCLGL